jgi:glyoxylase-like metal-dependent hydrolase (beta-lactamase superfamily II)
MSTKRLAAIITIGVMACWPLAGQDVTSVLQRVDNAMGGLPPSIQYTGTGANYQFGQSVRPAGPWPKYIVKSYAASINYDTPSMRVEFVRIQEFPGAIDQHQVQVVSGIHAWNMIGRYPSPAPTAVAERLSQIWATPHGFVRAAAASASTAIATEETVKGRRMVRISFVAQGKFRFSGLINDQNLVEEVDTWLDNPLTGDTPLVTKFTRYRDFGGVKFPAHLIQSYGGFPILELDVSAVTTKVAGDLPVPSDVQLAANPTIQVATQKIADGVWYMAGGSHHSVVVEFPHYVAVIEGPLDEARSVAVIDEIKKVIANKPIRYLINTHHHFDHSGGVRTYVAEGATLITHAMNRPFYDKVFAAPRTLNPDRLALSKKEARFETLKDKRVLSDGDQTLELYHVRGNPHNDAILMAYLPKQKMLIEADLYLATTGDVPLDAIRRAFAVNLYDNVQRLKLDVAPVVPLHGPMTTWANVVAAIGRVSTTSERRD